MTIVLRSTPCSKVCVFFGCCCLLKLVVWKCHPLSWSLSSVTYFCTQHYLAWLRAVPRHPGGLTGNIGGDGRTVVGSSVHRYSDIVFSGKHNIMISYLANLTFLSLLLLKTNISMCLRVCMCICVSVSTCACVCLSLLV